MSDILFHTGAYRALGGSVAKLIQAEVGTLEKRQFPDGERYLRMSTGVAGRDVVILGGTFTDSDTLELYDLASGAVSLGARSLTLVIPYFGYSTMERATRPGEIVTAKTRARLISSIPVPASGSRVVMLDLHAEGIPFYFEGTLRPVHLYAKSVLLEAIRSLGIEDTVLACTDAGRAKWVESLANDLGLDAGFIFKRRLSGEKTEVAAVSARVAGQHVILYDDMIRTGSSLVGAARAYRDAGATRISAVATHGVLPGESLEKVLGSGLFDTLICTDSHPRVLELHHPQLRVVSVAPVIARFLQGDGQA